MSVVYPFKLQFTEKAIRQWAEEYYFEYDNEIESIIAPQVKARGYFLQDEFNRICRWKTPRSQRQVSSNPAEYIEAVTKTALAAENERLRIEVLLLLNGVRWPTASVILHFCHNDPYPILDVRALWSLGMNASDVIYNFDFWWAYTQFCRNRAEEASVTMRELDRALWQYSKENQ